MPPTTCGQASCVLRRASVSASTFPSSSQPSVLPRSQTRHASAYTRQTKLRSAMWTWLNGPGRVFREPKEGSTNYLGAYDKSGRLIRARNTAENEKDGDGAAAKNAPESDKETREDLRPFPLNPYFRSQPVLSDELKDKIYKSVAVEGKSIREVSQHLHVEMRRIAAVVRLKTIELEWTKQDKPLAKTYARAIHSMIPITPYSNDPDFRVVRHESINDLPVHESTLPQIFHPVPESRQFTRADASKAFHRDLLPADARIPHPDMIDAARDVHQGLPQGDRARRRQERFVAEETVRTRRKAQQETEERQARTVIEGKRWDFVFKEMDSEANAGKDGRNAQIGWRYGFPLEDRKKGMVKIPTSVD